MWVSRWQMSTEYLSGASNYTQMNLSELVGRLTLELVSALHDSSAVRWRLLSRRKKKFLEYSHTDEMIICCLCRNKQHAINFMWKWEINIPVLSGDGKLSKVHGYPTHYKASNSKLHLTVSRQIIFDYPPEHFLLNKGYCSYAFTVTSDLYWHGCKRISFF